MNKRKETPNLSRHVTIPSSLQLESLKVNFTLERIMKAQMGITCIILFL